MANLSIPESKSKGVGTALVVFTFVWFLFYWIWLTAIAQAAILRDYPEVIRTPFITTFVGALIVGIIGGGVFATSSYLSVAFLNQWWKTKWNIPYSDFKWHDIFAIKSFWFWAATSIVLFIIFTLVWRSDL